jgi:ubiquinone/menaquinone biosynthesis C-methylase UbiE
MLGVARRLTRRRASITWVEASAELLPLPDESASVVWALATVHHWPDVGAGLAEVHRVLRTGGRLLAIERSVRAGAEGLSSHGWTEAQAESFASACRAAGFTDVVVGEHRPGRAVVHAVQARRP